MSELNSLHLSVSPGIGKPEEAGNDKNVKMANVTYDCPEKPQQLGMVTSRQC